jgi:uncharacterized repeat protein (TIGR01451 family)
MSQGLRRLAGLFLRIPGAIAVALVVVLMQFSTPAAAHTRSRPVVYLQVQDPTVAAGQEVTWFITVTNPLGVPLKKVTISDGTVFPKCSHDFTGSFPAHASEAYVCTFVPSTVGTLSNMVTITYGARQTAGIPSGTVTATVTAAAPTVSTALTPAGPVLAGTSVSDQATLSGATSSAGGTVSYAVYSDGNCTVQVATLGTQTVTDGVVGPSSGWTATGGTYWFQATYSGDASNKGPVSSPCSSEPITVEAPSIGITELPSNQEIASGGTATWTVDVTNTGNVALSDVTVSDPVAPDCDDTFVGTLAAGASETSYSCSFMDSPASFTNTATATGTPPVGPNVSESASAAVTVAAPPGIDILQLPLSQDIGSGSTASWSILIQNTGDGALSNVTVSDPLAPDCAATFAGTLAPEASEPEYGCSLADVTVGFTNTATVTGTPASGSAVSSSSQGVVTIEGPGIGITESPVTQTVMAGGTATWTIVVTNTGNATLSNVSVSDPVAPDCVASFTGTLAAGASEPGYSCSLTGPTADFANTATATGTPPTGPDVTNTAMASVTVTAYTPSVATALSPSPTVLAGTSVSDQATLSGAGPMAGGIVSYALYADGFCGSLVTTLGTATVTNGIVGPSTGWTATAGDYWFVATYSGDASDTGPVSSACSGEPVTVEAPGIALVQSASITSYGVPGTPVTFLYRVTDTGNTTLDPVTVTDPMPGLSAISCPRTLLGLAQTEICTATYTTTRADMTAGSIAGTGTATGTPDIGPAVTTMSSVTVPVSRAPGISLQKTASVTTYGDGTPITYSYLVTNSGTAPLKAITVTDPMPGLSAVDCPVTKLAVRGSETCTAMYTTTLADERAGSLTNTGTVTGTPPTGPAVSGTSSLTIVVGVNVESTGLGDPGFTTSPASGSITLGGSDSDTGAFNPDIGPSADSVTDAEVTPPPTGSVAFYVCGPSPTAMACTTSGTALGTAAVSDSGSTASVTSPAYTPSAVGIYCYLGIYSGDVNYSPTSDDAVPSECFTVGPGPAGFTTAPSGSIALGGSETDTAALTGVGTTAPTGSVTFYVTTATGVVDLGSGELSGTGPDTASVTSRGYTPSAVGTYCFLGLYSGDSNYVGASDSAIPGECFTVTRHQGGPS